MRLVEALHSRPLDRPPVWFMRQAGRYLPEYRDLRSRLSFEESMRTPAVAAEITLQPLRRFQLDAAIIFSDIMTPLAGMGVEMAFAPGPKLASYGVKDVTLLPDLRPGSVDFVGETIATVRAQLAPEVAVIGFAGAPATLLAYLLEGGGSSHFPQFRAGLHHDLVEEALDVLARAMRRYLELQIEAGADVVQLFDSWAGLLAADQFERLAVPAARRVLADLDVPTIYFAPGAAHLLDRFHLVGATGYGVDWRLPLGEAWARVGTDIPLQGNLDPAVLMAGAGTTRAATAAVLAAAGQGTGHIFNLGHGIFPDSPLESVAAMVDTVVGWPERRS
ncbi:MAG TPA: uroporphyrinogen decarboxylase [Acidimicrobiia bacterium]|nr:uroporphyrinogen decarboxylase [Acidimicrobiia bacterium]